MLPAKTQQVKRFFFNNCFTVINYFTYMTPRFAIKVFKLNNKLVFMYIVNIIALK